MTVPSFQLPLPVRAYNRLLAALPPTWQGDRLQPGRILGDVQATTGDASLLPPRVTDALEVLCRSYRDDANLHAWGRFRMYMLLQDALVQRARLERAFLDRPELASQPLVPPIFVTGLFRSGTTFLHRLLVAAVGARTLSLGDLLAPFPRPGPFLSATREAQLKFDLLRWTSSPELDAMHYMRLDLAEECVVALRLDLRSMLLWRSAPALSYHRWLFEQDLTDTYLMYRRLLQHYQATTPDARLTLKAPMHLLALPTLLEVFPDALVVHTHRDPLQIVPSDHKLAFAFHGGVSDGVDPARVVETNTRGLAEMAERSVAAHEGPLAARICDVDYRALTRDPVATVGQIFGHFGLPYTAEVQARAQAFVDANPQNKHGANRYTLEQFGQSPAEIERRFARYRARFFTPEA